MLDSLTGVHFLISYGCSAECDHCFVWASPRKRAGMTAAQVDDFLDQVKQLPTVTGVCADGGESFTRYDVVLALLRGAAKRGLSASALTNAFWVTSREQAAERVAGLLAAGLTSLGVSTDEWHRTTVPEQSVDTLLEVCAASGLEASRMETRMEGVMFRGRAAARLAPNMPAKPPSEFTACPHEKLGAPSRVHLDCYGRLHLCQGITLEGSRPAESWRRYRPESHAIVRVLLEEGPCGLARLAAERGFPVAEGYVDACHLCYRSREHLRPFFPELLGPDEMYGE